MEDKTREPLAPSVKKKELKTGTNEKTKKKKKEDKENYTQRNNKRKELIRNENKWENRENRQTFFREMKICKKVYKEKKSVVNSMECPEQK